MKKVTIRIPRLIDVLTQSRKPPLKKSKVIPPQKGGSYNRAKIKAALRKNP